MQIWWDVRLCDILYVSTDVSFNYSVMHFYIYIPNIYKLRICISNGQGENSVSYKSSGVRNSQCVNFSIQSFWKWHYLQVMRGWLTWTCITPLQKCIYTISFVKLKPIQLWLKTDGARQNINFFAFGMGWKKVKKGMPLQSLSKIAWSTNFDSAIFHKYWYLTMKYSRQA